MSDNEFKIQTGLLHHAIAEIAQLVNDLLDRLEAQDKEKEIKA